MLTKSAASALMLMLVAACAAPDGDPAPASAVASCTPPPGFAETPRPGIDGSRMVSRVQQIEIGRPLGEVVRLSRETSLEDTIAPGSGLPHVTGTYNLTPGPFGEPGSRRITCLSDASTLVEEVLVNETSGQVHTFRYVVWNYTSPAAAAVSHAAGEFVYAAEGDSATNVTWTYAFTLKEDRLPGSLGPFGRWLFRVNFLDGDYADLMQQTLLGMKANAEATGPGPDR